MSAGRGTKSLLSQLKGKESERDKTVAGCGTSKWEERKNAQETVDNASPRTTVAKIVEGADSPWCFVSLVVIGFLTFMLDRAGFPRPRYYSIQYKARELPKLKQAVCVKVGWDR